MKITSEYPLKRAAINASASGNNTLVAAVAGKRIRVVGLFLLAAGAVVATFQDDDDNLTGAISLANGNGFVLPASTEANAWLETGVGENLILNLSAAVQVSGALLYVEI